MPIQLPVSVHTTILSEPSTSDLSETADKRMKTRLDELRNPVNEGDVHRGQCKRMLMNRILTTPASMTLPYPGLDGHQQRRIKPIPISLPLPPVEKPTRHNLYQNH